ncbi:hypothetical protein E6C76_13630 [Pseudothauera nasutitermitis]|uniref:Autotransporter domain-containing protein n=1 Tax=Pseudothauera nasutitermitis TaxID=2565930 RepID=A0A4S4AVN2_9RHOO|nr:cadherin-like beta sandwich domain-containing protein [Pseudothauera nasutitermitis]THF63630.1 hypothetical protein E6C76_13630 [Pseudothauera nasutitermitis]
MQTSASAAARHPNVIQFVHPCLASFIPWLRQSERPRLADAICGRLLLLFFVTACMFAGANPAHAQSAGCTAVEAAWTNFNGSGNPYNASSHPASSFLASDQIAFTVTGAPSSAMSYFTLMDGNYDTYVHLIPGGYAAGSASTVVSGAQLTSLGLEIDAISSGEFAVSVYCVSATPAPTVTSLSPTSGPTAGGTSVTITGANFTGATGVTFGGTAGTGLVVTNATTITVATPAHAAGAVNVAVTTPGGTATLPNGYTYAAPSTDATLSSLAASAGALDPAFASGTTSYTVNVPNATTSTTVTPTVTDANATVTVNGTPVASGSPSGAISLSVGANPITVVVTAQDGTTTQTYTVTVNRAAPASTEATLSNLAASAGTLDPAFASGTTSYTVNVPNATASTTLTPTVTDANATVTVNGTPVASGSPSGAISLNVGANPITVVVTAQDSTTTQTYTVTIHRAAPASTEATLSSLAVSAGALDPAFAPGTTSYTVNVPNATASTTLTPTVTDANATVTVNGTPVTSGSPSGAISLNVGANPITVVVTAQDSTTTQTYTVTIHRAAPASTEATLSSLAASAGTLDPTFASSTTSYTVNVPNATASTTLTPTVTDTNATVTVNGTPVASGSPSGAISLSVGANPVTVVVTAQDSTTTQTYTVTIHRAAPASTEATLSSLAVSAGALDPAFAPGTTSYTVNVPNATASTTLTPTVTDANATVTVNGTPVTSGSPSGAISLNVGANPITVVVTAQDSTTTQTYTVTIHRAAPASTEATLSSLAASAGTLDPTFASSTTSYTVNVPNATASTTLTPTVTDSNATVTVNGTPVASGSPSGAISLNVGTNPITVVVTAQDGTTTQTYTVTINRAAPASTEATLSSLAVSAGALDPAFAPGTTSYTVNVPTATASTTLTPTVTDANATVTVNGTPVASGSPSGAISLNVGANPVTVVVTAQDGTTTQTYTVTVNRAAPVTLALSPASGALPGGTTGSAYSQTLTASGGIGAHTFTATGNLPAGLTLAPDGTLSGTPTAAGSFSFTVTAADSATPANTGSASYTLTVVVSPVVLTFSGGVLPEGMAGEDYSASITASGGAEPYTYNLAGGTLPQGISLNASTGELAGPLEADAAGDYSFTIQAQDANGATASVAVTLKVAAREVTVTDKQVEVPAGAVPAEVDLAEGATGGPFTAAEIVSVAPANAGTAEIVSALAAQASVPGWYLKFAPNPAYAGQAVVRFRLTSALGVSNTGAVTYTLGHDADAVASEIDTLVRGFVQTRQNLIASTIKVPGLLERRRMQASTEPVSVRLSPAADGLTLGFATGLAQAEAARKDGAHAAPFNVWIDGSLMVHNRRRDGSRWGRFGMLSAGADYLLTDKALAGLSFHYDRTTDPTKEDVELTGNGWLAGPYASFELGSGVFWNTSLLYGGSSNKIDTLFWDGSFDTRRWLFDTSISGQWQLEGEMTLTPRLRAVYLKERVDDYAVANARGDVVDVGGFATEQSRVSLGAELARRFRLDSGATLTPKLGLTGGFSGLDGSGAFGSVSAAINYQSPRAWTLDAGLLFNFEGKGRRSAGAKVGIGAIF